jgi:hypothetical protein
MYFKWLACVVLVFMLGGCKDLLNKPLAGNDADASRYNIEGHWFAKSNDTHLELKKTDKAGWYQFSVREPKQVIEGKVMVAYFKNKLALSVDMATLKIDGELLAREDKQAYFLIGAYYSDDELRIAPADMEKFERNFADYFFAAPIEISGFCIKTSAICKNTFTSGNLLYSKNRRKFNEDFEKHFRTVFPRRDSVIFTPVQ